jgi:hypothetical protein
MNKFLFKFLNLFLVSKRDKSDFVFTPVFAC